MTLHLFMQQYTKPLYHILRRLNLPKSTLQTFELKTGLGKIGGKKLFYRIAANENEILLKFFQVFLFILWALKIQGVESRARSQSFTNSNSSIFANLHKDSSRLAIWPALLEQYQMEWHNPFLPHLNLGEVVNFKGRKEALD